jgi:Fur family ferric uptake transcriptional regulator
MEPLCAVFRRSLRERNLKYTPERADVLNAIIERDAVFEVEDLLKEMRRRGHRVSKATIYRTIKLLQDAGIITQALFDSKQAHYQLVYGKAPRDYMVCMKTSRYIEFSDDTAWGSQVIGPPDFDADGIVATSDLLALLSNWGSCPP